MGLAGFCFVGGGKATSVRGGAPLFGGETEEITVLGVFWTGVIGGTGAGGGGSVFTTAVAGEAPPPANNSHTVAKLTPKQLLRPVFFPGLKYLLGAGSRVQLGAGSRVQKRCCRAPVPPCCCR